jgi:hypothetical protein
MRSKRLGDDIDDHCVRCKRITGHVIIAFVGEEPAKVRCASCYHEHPYLGEQAPAKKGKLPAGTAA